MITEKQMASKMNLLASRDEASTAKSGAKGIINLTSDGNVLCIKEPSRIGATTTCKGYI